MTLLTPTAKQSERANRDRKIAADFHALRRAYPGAPVMRILRTIADSGKYGLKPEGLKRVLLASGDITQKPRA